MSDFSTQPGRSVANEEASGARLCSNCGERLCGEYCYRCGQRDRQVIDFFPTLVREAFAGVFAFESRTWRTLWYLFTRPALLTSEYLAGRRLRFLPPVRLFIAFVLVFLFTVSFEMFMDSVGVDINKYATEATQDNDDDVVTSADMEELESGVLDLIEPLRVPFLSDANNQRFVALLQERAIANIRSISEDPFDFVGQLLDYLPVLLLMMMPLLALVQKLAYLGSGRYYIEHLLLTLHNHSFLLLVFILLFLLDLLAWSSRGVLAATAGFLGSLLNLWAIAYLFMSLRLFFSQGYLLTTFKFLAMSITYGAMLITGTLLLTLISFFIY